MRFEPLHILGAFAVHEIPHEDARGQFSRLWDRDEQRDKALCDNVTHISLSQNIRKGTLRGLHMQLPPMQEVKTVRCMRGRVYDVIVDMRPTSETFGQWYGRELSEANGAGLYIPSGCAHGFQALEDDSHVLYVIEGTYAPSHSITIRWDDPELAIAWPLPEEAILSQNDAAAPSFNKLRATVEERNRA